jgi:hypothetical protein
MSQAASQLLTNTLKTVSNLSSDPLKEVWKTLLVGEFFRAVSVWAAGFSGIFLVFWTIQHLLNQKRSAKDQVSLGNIWQYIIITLILFCLVTPDKTGAVLFGFHESVHKSTNTFIEQISKINGDPNAAMAKIISTEQVAANGQAQCDAISSTTEKEKCFDALREKIAKDVDTSGGWGEKLTSIAQGIGQSLAGANLGTVIGQTAVNVGLGSDGINAVKGFFQEIALMLLGTAFLLILEVGQLTAAIMFPVVLLIGLFKPIYVMNWVKSFFSWGLIVLAYKVMVSSIAFAMLQLDFNNTSIYAFIVGIFAPFAAYQVISGSTLGLLGAVGRTVSKAVPGL